MERPSYDARLIYDLKVACAKLVNETNPPDPEDETDHQEILRQFEAERKAKLVTQARAAEAKSQKGEVRELKSKARKEEPRKDLPKRYSSSRPRDDIRTQEPKVAAVPVQPPVQTQPTLHRAASGFNAFAQQRRVSDKVKPFDGGVIEPVHTRVTPLPQDQRRPTDEAAALNEIRRSIHSRPKTSAAACVDYQDQDSSKSTSRSTSNFDTMHRPTSTGLTSLAHTPGEEKRRSHFRRPSDQSYQEDLEREKAVWFKEQQAKHQAEQLPSGGRSARPESRTESRMDSRTESRTSKLSRMTSRSESQDRPPSRASSFASSIADGISNYIRPRSSTDGGRSGRSSVMGMSRSASRSSSTSRRSSSGFWRRGSLRRKGSWASFRSGRFDNDEKSTKKNGEPNLNRPLPALPGLDQYKETKTHIGQLMKAGGRRKKVTKKSISDPKPVMAPDTEYTSTLPKPATPILDRALQREEEERAHKTQGQQPHHRHQGHQPEDRYSQQEHHHDHPRRSTVPKNMESKHRSSKEKPDKRQSRSQNPPRRSTAPILAYSDVDSDPISSSDPRTSSLNKSPTNASLGAAGTFHTHPLSPTLTNASSKLHNAPPIIRGPSYKKELEAGVYPRPMEVNNGTNSTFPSNYEQYYDVKLVDVEAPSARRHTSGLPEVHRPSAYDVDGLGDMYRGERGRHRDRDRDEDYKAGSAAGSGLKGKMGRMFGSGSGSVGGGGTRRAVAAN